MVKVELKEMTLTDFKGQEEKKVTFGHRTIVSGPNGCGKTTLADAFMWAFCDRDYSLKSNPDIRPDDGKECLPRADLELIIDGKPVSISKYQKRTESKTGRVTLSNKYVIDGDDTGLDGFKDFLREYGLEFKKFLMLSHMEAFANEKDKDAREILLSMPSGEEQTDLSIARKTSGCEDIVPLLEKCSFKKIEKDHKDDLKEADEKLKDIPGKIKGKEELKVDYDTAELELQKNAIQSEIAGIEEQISKAGNERATEIKAELVSLRVKKGEIESGAKTDLVNNRMIIQNAIRILQLERNQASGSLNAKTDELEKVRKNKADISENLKNAQQQYIEVRDRKYNNELKNIESETFNGNDAVCPTCGQTLPEEQIEELKEKFEQKKQERINELYQKRTRELLSIEASGNKIKFNKEATANREKKLVSEVTELTENLEEINASLSEENTKLEAIPAEPDLSQNAEYQQILADIKAKEQELAYLDDGEEAKKQLNEQLKSKKYELAAVNQKIGEANNNVRIDEQIEELEASRKGYSQKKADAQMILDELKSLSMAKNTALEDAVNQYFDGVKVKLFDAQKNGEVVDACIWYVQDKDGNWKKLIGNANTALMMKGKIAIMDGLQKFYGVSYPIFVDCAAELDNSSLAGIKADAQLIFLKVAEGEMTVTEI